MKLLEVESLRKVYGGGFFSAVRETEAVCGVSFELSRGEIVGLIGESGSGKTTVGRCVLMLEDPSAGRIIFEGVDLSELSREGLRVMRPRMQMVFQNPYGSMNPRHTVRQIISEGVKEHGIVGEGEVSEYIECIMELCRLDVSLLGRYPHEISGGQIQRLGIARAASLKPSMIVADEPTSALDAATQREVLNLFEKLKYDRNLSFLFISHDLGVVECISDRILVMYGGEVVESGETRTVLSMPLHPYTQALVSAVPTLERGMLKRRVRLLEEDLPGIRFDSKCRFSGRCAIRKPICSEVVPKEIPVSDNQMVKCLLYS